ncbi:MAG: hypothetical protein OXD45_04780 [Rhodobacteraceae bacterium]|nr:hypothetical protein [Paracoccaceae bacterium]
MKSLGILTVEFSQKDDWHIATCNELEGFYLVNKDKNKIIKDIPKAIEVLVKAQFNLDVSVHPATLKPEKVGRTIRNPKIFKHIPWVSIPKEMTAFA